MNLRAAQFSPRQGCGHQPFLTGVAGTRPGTASSRKPSLLPSGFPGCPVLSRATAFCVDSLGQSVLCCLGLALRLDLKGLTVGDQRPSSVGRMLCLSLREPGCSLGCVPGDLGAFRISDCATLILRFSGRVVRLHPFQLLSVFLEHSLSRLFGPLFLGIQPDVSSSRKPSGVHGSEPHHSVFE